ncbi:molybdate ABC transporter ATP-binding protein ModF [Gallaecimonas pentaromativorans]|uniref:molybdate ABC transporter ATP-binding protein ModF n=1 Tax=Gallaecimonas pentaromativorans TaxID=584787 RepID=UPI003A941AD2
MWSIKEARFRVTQELSLEVPALSLEKGGCLAVTGGNGAGKSLLLRAIAGELTLLAGERTGPKSDALVSMDRQLALWDQAFKDANTDLVKDDEALVPSARTLLGATLAPKALALVDAFGLGHALDRPFTVLSSGEGRKLLLIKALLNEPPLLLLDEPFSGLDKGARQALMRELKMLNNQGATLVLALSRLDEVPDFCPQVALMERCVLTRLSDKEALLGERQQQVLPELPPAPKALPEVSRPLLKVDNLKVSYQDNLIIDGLSWTLAPGQHWQIAGPNGAGKSTLLSVLTGDNPQGFSNEVYLFGKKRGSGETLWDIRQQQGLVSPALHGAYRVNCSALEVVLSGYFDSIGLYQSAGDNLRQLAARWLGIVGMAHKAGSAFLSLSYGEQRLLLIARAMVKHPPLLILDEPYQGIDEGHRQQINSFLSLLMAKGESQLLLVSHHDEDMPVGITHQLLFEQNKGGWHYRQGPLSAG